MTQDTGRFIIRRNNDGAYVAPPGRPSSYTGYLQDARRFPTREAAQKECCGNEHVAER